MIICIYSINNYMGLRLYIILLRRIIYKFTKIKIYFPISALFSFLLGKDIDQYPTLISSDSETEKSKGIATLLNSISYQQKSNI